MTNTPRRRPPSAPVQRQYLAGNVRPPPTATLSAASERKNPNPSARQHPRHGIQADLNRRRPIHSAGFPSENYQAAQSLALNPHRPTPPPAHTPPRFPPLRLFRRLPQSAPSRPSLAGVRKPLTGRAISGATAEWPRKLRSSAASGARSVSSTACASFEVRSGVQATIKNPGSPSGIPTLPRPPMLGSALARGIVAARNI